MRAYLTGDGDSYKQMIDQFDASARTAHAALIIASFIMAADRRFGKGSTRTDVAEFVSNLRARSEQLADDINQDEAERLITAVRTGEDIDDIDDGLYSLLLAGLIADAQLS